MDIGWVNSSNGGITINHTTGEVLEIEGNESIQNIVRFDLAEYIATYGSLSYHRVYDILDLGYWYTAADGSVAYEPPCQDHRNIINEGNVGLIVGEPL